MSCFADVIVPSAPPDATKHVNYSYGMVLGVEEFVQEFTYLSNWDRSLVRELIGYGTVRGLKVEYTTRGGEPELVVSEGVGVVPPGHVVRICQDQCAKLNPWLLAHRAEVEQALAGASPVESIRLAVVLRHHECLTDEVPIPGEPCRSDEDAMAPSRVKDDFRLELRLITQGGGGLPNQKEEDVLRQFAAALKAVPVEDPTAMKLPRETWVELLKQWEWVPGSDTGTGLPGASIPSDEATEYYRDAFRIWATELRPRYARPASNLPPTPPPRDERFLLLAEVEVYLTSQFQVHDLLKPLIDEQQRPVLLHLRLIQELLCPCPPREATFPSPIGPAKSGPPPGDTVVQEWNFGQSASPGTVPEYSRADHTHGTPEPPILGGDVQDVYSANRVARLLGVAIDPPATPPTAFPPGQVLTLVGTGTAQRWAPAPLPVIPPVVPTAITLGGDATGAPGANTVARIQGITVAPTLPTDRQILRCAIVGGQPQWVPEAFPSSPSITLGGDVTGAPDANTVGRIQGLRIANSPSDQQTLQYQQTAGNLRWVSPPPPPALNDVVRHPTIGETARYFLVAAGSFRFDFRGQTVNVVGRPFNNLNARVAGTGRLLFNFNRYTPPDDRHQYIVKLTPWIPNLDIDAQLFFAVLFDFQDDIIVNIRFPFADGQITRGQLQVEVSEYIF